MRIIPAIDIIDGKCVRLSMGDYAQKKVYREDPLEVAKEFEDHGIRFLHLVDLDGAKTKHIVNQKTLERIAHQTNLQIDFGGGLKTREDVRIALESGATQITGGSIAVKDPEEFIQWIELYGSERIILGADVKKNKIAVSGWLEESDRELLPFIDHYRNQGVRYVISTDISKDGMLQGPSFELYRSVLNHDNQRTRADKPLALIASGGITTPEDLHLLKEIGCEGAIVGKAFYEGKITFKDMEPFL